MFSILYTFASAHRNVSIEAADVGGGEAIGEDGLPVVQARPRVAAAVLDLAKI